MVRYEIVLDNTVFLSGGLINGRVELELNKETKLRAIYMIFRGFSELRFTERSSFSDIGSHSNHGRHGHHTSSRRGRQVEVYTNRETYFDHKFPIYGKSQTGQDQTKLKPGQYAFPFQLTVPDGVPSSYESLIGRVRYMLKSYIDIPWGFDKKTKRMITVANVLNLNLLPAATQGTVRQDQKRLGFLCCESDPIAVTLKLDRLGYVPGESVCFQAEVVNQSNRNVSCTKAQLVMMVKYHAIRRSKEVVNVIGEVTHGRIEPGGTDHWTGAVHVPPVPPSFLQGCNIIDVHYFLNFTVVPSGMAIDLTIPVDIYIGTIPLASVAAQHGLTLPSAPPGGQTAGPAGMYNAYIMPSSMPNVTMAESAMGRMSTREEDDTAETYGATDFAPVYTYYNWNKPDPNHTFAARMNQGHM